MPSVYLVEDDAVTRTALAARIDALADHRVELAAATCAEIRSAIEARAPDVLLVDLGLPDGDGLEVIRSAVARWPGLRVMVITVFGDERRVVAALKAGASGYLLKDDSSIEIGAALEQLLAGGAPISPAIARHLIAHFRAEPAATGTTTPSTRGATRRDAGEALHLSERERELLQLAAKGFTYAEIAKMLAIMPNTVASYTKRIYTKLSVGSRAEAVFEASRLGLLGQGSRDP